jgi:hypothetical protein
VKTADLKTRTIHGLILVAAFSAAAFGGCSSTDSSAPGGSSGGTSSTNGVVGYFSVTLNPAIDTTQPYTTIFGKVYTGPQQTSVIETPVASNAECKVVSFSQQSCTNPACTTEQTCVATNNCQANPTLVTVGDVTMAGIGSSDIKLSATNKNYQYAGDIIYPGFAEGATITMSATGDFYSAFSVSSKGVAPIVMSEASYMIDSGTALALKWTPGSSATGAKVNLGLNISKHGGSAGYLSCDVADTGSYTIPADLVTKLIGLGVAGFPQLTVTRSTTGEATVSSGTVQLAVQSLAIPNLQVKGYCSCFASADCGSCADTTKTTCDTVKKLCNAP